MWDNPTLLRNTSTALFAASLLLTLYGAVYYLAHMPNFLPLHTVRLSAATNQVDATDVLQVIRDDVQGNFLTVDIEQLKTEIEKLPWVRHVQIRREFPDRLRVELEEHQALARWNDDELVNQHGEVFNAEIEKSELLPGFIGQPNESQQVTQQYLQFNEQLARIHLQVKRVVQSPRNAWQLRLSNGMELKLGSEQIQQRLAKFVAVYPYSLGNMQEKVKTVDLRYRNGFAVGGLSKQS